VKVFELSWSVNALAICPVSPYASPVSLVTPVTLSKDPTAVDMWPVTSAETSFPLPTVRGRGPRAGGFGTAGGVVHGTSCHSVLGYEDVKHPFFGRGTCVMPARQSFRLCVGGACVVAGGALGAAESPDVCAKAAGANARNVPIAASTHAIISRMMHE
jgi:hypothetical protein